MSVIRKKLQLYNFFTLIYHKNIRKKTTVIFGYRRKFSLYQRINTGISIIPAYANMMSFSLQLVNIDWNNRY